MSVTLVSPPESGQLVTVRQCQNIVSDVAQSGHYQNPAGEAIGDPLEDLGVKGGGPGRVRRPAAQDGPGGGDATGAGEIGRKIIGRMGSDH